MVLLSAIVVPMAMLASWKIEERVPLYFALVLFLQAGLVRHVHRAELLPLVHLLGTEPDPGVLPHQALGRAACARPAATQFFVYTMVGSVAMLLAFLAIFLATGKFDFIELADMGRNGTLTPALGAQARLARP